MKLVPRPHFSYLCQICCQSVQ